MTFSVLVTIKPAVSDLTPTGPFQDKELNVRPEVPINRILLSSSIRKNV